MTAYAGEGNADNGLPTRFSRTIRDDPCAASTAAEFPEDDMNSAPRIRSSTAPSSAALVRVDDPTLADLHETAEHHDGYGRSAPKHDWRAR